MFSRKSSSSPAARAALDRVIADERHRSATFGTKVRVLATGVGALMMLVELSNPVVAVSLKGAWVYFALATIIAVIVHFAPATASASAFAVPFIDVPLLTVVHHLQLEPLGALRHHNLPANLVMMTALLISSSLTMSIPVIALTAATALISMESMLYRCDYPLTPMLLTGIGAPAIAIISSVLVNRIRRLVRESRSRDLLGKYIMGRRLGAGGMAEVFEATYAPEGGFERRVAVKRILPSYAGDATAIALFRREAELGATLAHPNLVHVLDFGSDGDTYFLAMELVDGCSLHQVFAASRTAQRPIELRVVTYIAWCMAEALDHLHEHVSPSGSSLHLVHRDINPPNVLVSRGGDVKISDFGIVRDSASANLTRDGAMRGKLAYAPPEQVMGKPIDGRVDLFALGVTLWEILLGRRLFRAESEVELVKLVLNEPITPVTRERDDVPPVFADAVMGLLERDPERRTPTARRFLQQLAHLPPDVLDVREGRRLLAEWVRLALGEVAAPRLDPQTATLPPRQ